MNKKLSPTALLVIIMVVGAIVIIAISWYLR